ncbi:hypothetical protein QZH41_013145, partial [Actinostola sp. cb2023]
DKRDSDGAAIAVYTAQRNSSERNRKVIMNNIYLQLDEAVKSPETQRNGVILLYDFSNTSYMTSDVQVCVNIITMLK